MGFTEKETALFIGVVGLLSVVAQTAGLTILMKTVGNKNTIIIGLGKCEHHTSCFVFNFCHLYLLCPELVGKSRFDIHFHSMIVAHAAYEIHKATLI